MPARFIYTDKFDDKSFRTVSQLLPLAEKYNVRRLSLECGQSLLKAMCVENASEIAIIGQARGNSRELMCLRCFNCILFPPGVLCSPAAFPCHRVHIPVPREGHEDPGLDDAAEGGAGRVHGHHMQVGGNFLFF